MDLNTIHLGNARVLGKQITNNSVDLILTDPPYLKKFLYLYSWLARFAARVLKPGGYLICYGPGMFIPEVIRRFTVKGLDYFWLEPLLHNGGWPRIWSRNLMSGYKPIFVYTKGKPRLMPGRGTIHADKADKRYHEWGQGTGLAIYFMELLTDPGDLVLDPFAGGGNVLSAAKAMGRQYLGFEKDKKTYKVVSDRLLQEQFPLFPTPRQERQLNLPFAEGEVEFIDVEALNEKNE